MFGDPINRPKLESMIHDIQAKPCRLSLQLLTDITDNFSDEREIGRGGLGIVYKGVLDNGDIVAVKKLKFIPGAKDGHFENEVYHLMELRHQNIVRFLGYCFEIQHICMKHEGRYCFAEMPEKLLCMEYLPNGSLDSHISDESCGLDWQTRYKIIEGICVGLHYLHEGRGTSTHIIHLDLKPANILLAHDMMPKIADFGLARLCDKTIHTNNLVGSVGYMAPEYWLKGIISKKSDIFSLGVIVIEIITGHRDYPESTGTSAVYFVEKVLEKWRDRLKDLRYTSLEMDFQKIKGCVEIGLNCVQIEVTKRPTTKEVLETLKRLDDPDYNLEEDEQLARALQESLNAESPHLYPSSEFRTCAGCKYPIGHGRFLSCMNSVWHPQCFRCFACNKPISEYEFAVHKDQPYHRSCYKEFFHPKCDVCNNFIPTNRNGLIEYRAHPFWMQKYCPSHEDDGTPRCCSCERMEPAEVKYITLDDSRKLCLECLNSAIMDTPECQQLYIDIHEFFEGLNMKVERQVPLLLVERQALNEAMVAEKNGHHIPESRSLCLSEEQIVRMILRRPSIGPGNRIRDMITGQHKLTRLCEVTAILVLYGLPRFLTGSIIAHEMMHAYLSLEGYRNLSPEVEEGICQVLSHMWLESQVIIGSGDNVASSSAASSSSPSSYSTPTSSKTGSRTDFEKTLCAFLKHQIETDTSEAYGDGFRAGNQAVECYGLRNTLDHIRMTGSFPIEGTEVNEK